MLKVFDEVGEKPLALSFLELLIFGGYLLVLFAPFHFSATAVCLVAGACAEFHLMMMVLYFVAADWLLSQSMDVAHSLGKLLSDYRHQRKGSQDQNDPTKQQLPNGKVIFPFQIRVHRKR